MENHKEIMIVKACVIRLLLILLSLCLPNVILATITYGHQDDFFTILDDSLSVIASDQETLSTESITGDPMKPLPDDSINPIEPTTPEDPLMPNSGYSVGTPVGNVSVSSSGAAFYSLNIEVPDGGSLTPHVGLSYLSAALNAAGYDIPNIYGTMKGEDSKGYFLRAVDLNKYLSSKSSPVKLTYITFNPNNVKNGLIYVYPGKEWQLQGITGHVDVVFRKIWASHVYDKNYSGGNPYGYRYKSNVFH